MWYIASNLSEREPMQKVSVIVPAYNSSKFIKETIRSVQNQTYKNWELLITDDASTDDTYQILLHEARNDERIKIIRNKENRGPGFSRNKAIEQATGRYLAFLDSDDLWREDKLAKQIFFMEKNHYPISHTSYGFINEKGKPMSVGSCQALPEIDLHTYMKFPQLRPSATIVDTKLAGPVEFPNSRVLGEDIDAWLKLLKNGNKSYGIQENLAFYRVRKNQLSANKAKMALQQFKRYSKEKSVPFYKRMYYWACYASNAVYIRISQNKMMPQIKMNENLHD